MENVAAAGSIERPHLKGRLMLHHSVCPYEPASGNSTSNYDCVTVLVPKRFRSRLGRSLPRYLGRHIFGKNDMINQPEQFLKPGIMVLFKISHNGDTGGSGDQRGSEIPGHAVLIKKEDPRGPNHGLLRQPVVCTHAPVDTVEDIPSAGFSRNDNHRMRHRRIRGSWRELYLHAFAQEVLLDSMGKLVQAEKPGKSAPRAEPGSGPQSRLG